MNINSLPSQWEMGEQGGSRSSTHTEASECKAVRQHGKFFRIYRGRWYGAFEKSSRRGKSMGESVPGNIKSGGREKIMQEVKVPSGLCRGAAGSCKGAHLFPQESTNQPTKELYKTLSQNTDVLRCELTELRKRAAMLHGVTSPKMVILLHVH